VVKGAFTEHGSTTEFIIVGSGPHGAFPHHGYSDRKLQSGDALVLDIVGRRDGFPSDMTRMAVIGDEPEDYSKVHDIVERALLAGLAAAKVGGLSGDVDKAARQIIEAEGYGEYFTSRTGHGLGIEIQKHRIWLPIQQQCLRKAWSFQSNRAFICRGGLVCAFL